MVWGDWLFLLSKASTLQSSCFGALTTDNIFLCPHTLFHLETERTEKMIHYVLCLHLTVLTPLVQLVPQGVCGKIGAQIIKKKTQHSKILNTVYLHSESSLTHVHFFRVKWIDKSLDKCFKKFGRSWGVPYQLRGNPFGNGCSEFAAHTRTSAALTSSLYSILYISTFLTEPQLIPCLI